jgi:hypothetical protein
MLGLTNVLQIPNSAKWKGADKYKWPRLSEAYKFFFGRDFEDAHDAAVDSKACAEVYFAYKFFKNRMKKYESTNK